jgi:DNA-binding NarL/FixJ family response regulator
MHAEPPFAMKAFRAGASGYLLKKAASEDLIVAGISYAANHTEDSKNSPAYSYFSQ